MNRIALGFRHGNPFYLISAGCMLGGCLAINKSLAGANLPMPRDILLIGTLNLYEMAVIALAWHLVRRRGLIHDGVMLLALEAFFLVDVAFVNAEAITSNFSLGMALGGILFFGALLKLYYLAKIAGLGVRDGRFAAMAIQLAALFTVPIVFRHFDDGDLPALFFYGAWWTAGLLIPICFTMSGYRSRALGQPWMKGIVRLLCVLPWISFVLHLGFLHWSYNVSFYGAEGAPVLLGLRA
jgi:hypothetical protein